MRIFTFLMALLFVLSIPLSVDARRGGGGGGGRGGGSFGGSRGGGSYGGARPSTGGGFNMSRDMSASRPGGSAGMVNGRPSNGTGYFGQSGAGPSAGQLPAGGASVGQHPSAGGPSVGNQLPGSGSAGGPSVGNQLPGSNGPSVGNQTPGGGANRPSQLPSGPGNGGNRPGGPGNGGGNRPGGTPPERPGYYPPPGGGYYPPVYPPGYPPGYPGYGWNYGYPWYPAPYYYGGGFWGPWAFGVTTAVVLGEVTDEEGETVQSYEVAPDTPGAQLLKAYGLTQAQCGPQGLVVIWGPENSVICAHPNATVAAGTYGLDTSNLTISPQPEGEQQQAQPSPQPSAKPTQ